jgi:hypothetical protein
MPPNLVLLLGVLHTLLDILDDLGADAKTKREKQNSKLIGCYEIKKIN